MKGVTETQDRPIHGNPEMRTAMTAAFDRAGYEDGLRKGLHLVEKCWKIHQPNIHATAAAVKDSLVASEPIFGSLLMPYQISDVVRRLCNKHEEIGKIVRRNATQIALKKRWAGHT